MSQSLTSPAGPARAGGAGSTGQASTTALLARQIRFTNRAFWRNPASAGFTFAFPLMLLVIFTALFGGSGHVLIAGQQIKISTYYVASMAAFAVITACYTNVAMTITIQRDAGVLKRLHGTPLPAAVYFAARVLHAVLVAVLLVLITAAFGAAFYHADVPSGPTLGRFLVMLVVGAAAFAALGFAITSAVPNADAAPAVVNFSILPLLFLSGVFIPLGSNAPSWVSWVAKIFPVWHFTRGMQSGFLGTPFDWTDVIVVAAWGGLGLLLAVRRFSWEPRV